MRNWPFDLSLGAPDIGIDEDDAVVLAARPDPWAAAAASAPGEGVSPEQILRDRPDVLNAYFTEYNGPDNDPHSTAWLSRVGGTTPEAYADYWYRTYGAAEGYGSSAAAAAPEDGSALAAPDDQPVARTTADGVPLSQILHDRPDVFRLFFAEYYGPNNDRHSQAWNDRVGGSTPEDYAKYWYEHGGQYAYSPADGASARSLVDPAAYEGGRTTSDGVYLQQILHDRPDVYQLFFTEYYGPNNDHHSSAWMDRVGGATPEDYAKYWYENGGKYGYTPEPLKAPPQATFPYGPIESPGDDTEPGAATSPGGENDPEAPMDPAILLVGQTLTDCDGFLS